MSWIRHFFENCKGCSPWQLNYLTVRINCLELRDTYTRLAQIRSHINIFLSPKVAWLVGMFDVVLLCSSLSLFNLCFLGFREFWRVLSWMKPPQRTTKRWQRYNKYLCSLPVCVFLRDRCSYWLTGCSDAELENGLAPTQHFVSAVSLIPLFSPNQPSSRQLTMTTARGLS